MNNETWVPVVFDAICGGQVPQDRCTLTQCEVIFLQRFHYLLLTDKADAQSGQLARTARTLQTADLKAGDLSQRVDSPVLWCPVLAFGDEGLNQLYLYSRSSAGSAHIFVRDPRENLPGADWESNNLADLQNRTSALAGWLIMST